jgi:hypothetical protein
MSKPPKVGAAMGSGNALFVIGFCSEGSLNSTKHQSQGQMTNDLLGENMICSMWSRKLFDLMSWYTICKL